jgi:hypothetical protein
MAPVRAHLKSRDFAGGPRVFEYWRNVDPDLGKKVEEGVRANLNGNRA